MPRKNPVPDEETAICRRLHQFRRDVTLLSRAAFAKKLGEDVNRIASYEHGRVPLRFGLADKIGKAFNLNQVWLAEGKLSPTPYLTLDPDFVDKLPKNEYFSKVYQNYLRSAIIERQHAALSVGVDLAGAPPTVPPTEKETADMFRDLGTRMRMKFIKLSPSEQWLFVRAVHVAINEFLMGVPPLDSDFEDWEGEEKMPLTDVSDIDNISPVKSEMANLLGLLKKATSQRGMKSRMAKAFGVPLSTVSQWLSGKREPGGETTLRLLKWVEQHKL